MNKTTIKLIIAYLSFCLTSSACLANPFEECSCDESAIRAAFYDEIGVLNGEDLEQFKLAMRRIYQSQMRGGEVDIFRFCDLIQDKSTKQIVEYGLKLNEERRRQILDILSSTLIDQILLLDSFAENSPDYELQKKIISETADNISIHCESLRLPAIDDTVYFFEKEEQPNGSNVKETGQCGPKRVNP